MFDIFPEPLKNVQSFIHFCLVTYSFKTRPLCYLIRQFLLVTHWIETKLYCAILKLTLPPLSISFALSELYSNWVKLQFFLSISLHLFQTFCMNVLWCLMNSFSWILCTFLRLLEIENHFLHFDLLSKHYSDTRQ